MQCAVTFLKLHPIYPMYHSSSGYTLSLPLPVPALACLDRIEPDINRKGNINQHFTLDCPAKGLTGHGKLKAGGRTADRQNRIEREGRWAESESVFLSHHCSPLSVPSLRHPDCLAGPLKRIILINWAGKCSRFCCCCCCWVSLVDCRLAHSASRCTWLSTHVWGAAGCGRDRGSSI